MALGSPEPSSTTDGSSNRPSVANRQADSFSLGGCGNFATVPNGYLVIQGNLGRAIR